MYVHDAYGAVVMRAWALGDVSLDGYNNLTDMFQVKSKNATYDPWYDVNLDGAVNLGDQSLVKSWNAIKTTVPVSYSSVDNPYHFTLDTTQPLDGSWLHQGRTTSAAARQGFTGRTTDTLHASDPLVSVDPDFKHLQDNRNRTYDPKHGRWLQRDPERYVDGMNLHQYVKSRPTVYVDWRGRQATRPTPRPPGSGPSSGPASPETDWPKGIWWRSWYEEQRNGEKSDWQKAAEGELVDCPKDITLPPDVESALRFAWWLTTKDQNEYGGVMAFNLQNKHLHRVYRPVRGDGGEVNPLKSQLDAHRALYEETGTLQPMSMWPGYGEYHTHNQMDQDSSFGANDLIRIFERASQTISIVRTCSCTRAIVKLKRFKLARYQYPSRSPNPEVTPDDDNETIIRKEIDRDDRLLSELGGRMGFCFYRSCEASQRTLPRYPTPGSTPTGSPR